MRTQLYNMRPLKNLIFLLIIIIILYLILNLNNQSIDNYTQCLLHMNKALNSLDIPWFVTHGTALMYWRSKTFISNDIDIGIFYEDFQKKNYNEKYFLSIMKKKFRFKLKQNYGEINHGKEWTFLCPRSRINIDIFIFYPYKEIESSLFTYWTATYNGLCNKMIYKKCRWIFSDFNLTTFEINERKIYIVPIEFIIERYGKDYMIPQNYNYFQSLKFLPNLILEYNNQTK